MEQDFNSETDSDYTSYWRDWVSSDRGFRLCALCSQAGFVGAFRYDVDASIISLLFPFSSIQSSRRMYFSEEQSLYFICSSRHL